MSSTTEKLQRYYRFHASIYDMTRWLFLFGRKDIVSAAADMNLNPGEILEIGCGTGKNLLTLREFFPQANITGVDLSRHMLSVAQKKCLTDSGIELQQARYDRPLEPGKFDLILFSYALSMFNPGWEEAIRAAQNDLRPGGVIATVDFYNSKFSWFKTWMGKNHVRMDGHLPPELGEGMTILRDENRAALGGIWHYNLQICQKGFS